MGGSRGVKGLAGLFGSGDANAARAEKGERAAANPGDRGKTRRAPRPTVFPFPPRAKLCRVDGSSLRNIKAQKAPFVTQAVMNLLGVL